MEIYKQLRGDIVFLLAMMLLVSLLIKATGMKLDSTDKDSWTRSGAKLITDYGTGLEYLYRGGALIPRLDANGKQMRVSK